MVLVMSGLLGSVLLLAGAVLALAAAVLLQEQLAVGAVAETSSDLAVIHGLGASVEIPVAVVLVPVAYGIHVPEDHTLGLVARGTVAALVCLLTGDEVVQAELASGRRLERPRARREGLLAPLGLQDLSLNRRTAETQCEQCSGPEGLEQSVGRSHVSLQG